MIDELRKPKIFGMAIFDWAMTIIALIIIMMICSIEFTAGNIIKGTLSITAFAILTHVVTGTPTMLNHYLGLSEKPL